MKLLKKKWLRWTGLGILLLGGGILGLFLWNNEALPEGEVGERADSLARQMMQAINHEAWENTGAVHWVFREAREHLWDRKRHFAKVNWDDNEVIVNINKQTGIVKQKKFNSEATDEELVREAWEIWVNDSFWLNPVSKVFDPGTTRKLVKLDKGEVGLLITYQSGGATPGDSYLWLLDEQGLPNAWKLWVSIIPVGGMKFTWEKWITLSTGVKVSTFHHSNAIDIPLTDIQAASTLEALTEGQDPFQELMEQEPTTESKSDTLQNQEADSLENQPIEDTLSQE